MSTESSTTAATALYVHIPWCVKKCPYCDFNSHEIRAPLDPQAYLDCLLQDLDADLSFTGSRRISSIFFGGGTPSVLDAGFYHAFINALLKRCKLDSDAEITLEANPGTLDSSNFADYRDAGINRLSLGVQSFSDDHLGKLGRIHDTSQVFKAFEKARLAGFSNINIDLMFALPGQNQQQACSDLEQACKLQPEHLSWYQLTLEPNTAFYHKPPRALPDQDDADKIFQSGKSVLQQHGYRQYEVSAWSRDGFTCRHNLNYWQFGDYIGIGAGAHGKLTDQYGKIWRRAKSRHPADYLQKRFLSSENRLDENDLVIEFMMNTLRLASGFKTDEFQKRTGLPLAVVEAKLRQAQEMGLLVNEADRCFATDKGSRFLNDLLGLFM